MKKVKIKTYKEKMIFSVSLMGMYSFVKLFKKADGISSYITSNNIIYNVGELIPVISRENFTDNKYKTFIRNVSLGVGCFTSLIISIKTNGKKFFIDFCFNLISCSSSILIIDKLKKLNMVDGISIGILINFIFGSIKFISAPILTVLVQLANCLLFILMDITIFNICYGYGKLQYKNVHNYNFAMAICESIAGSIGFMLMPLILFVLNFSDIKRMKEGFNSNNLLPGIRLEDHEKKIFKTVFNYSLKLGCLGGVILLVNSFVGICSVYKIGMFTMALLRLYDDVRSYNSVRNVKGFLY
jgi:hypothetical protein